jgi:hypothetical protein
MKIQQKTGLCALSSRAPAPRLDLPLAGEMATAPARPSSSRHFLDRRPVPSGARRR